MNILSEFLLSSGVILLTITGICHALLAPIEELEQLEGLDRHIKPVHIHRGETCQDILK